jgi:serine/threonine protein kinase
LNHPNIVTVYDIGQASTGSFIAVELIEGRTLRELVVEGPMPSRRLLGTAVQIADGLAKAHEAGIVHRDLKPENVMVTRDGVVKGKTGVNRVLPVLLGLEGFGPSDVPADVRVRPELLLEPAYSSRKSRSFSPEVLRCPRNGYATDRAAQTCRDQARPRLGPLTPRAHQIAPFHAEADGHGRATHASVKARTRNCSFPPLGECVPRMPYRP